MVNSNTALELRERIFWVPTDLERLPTHREWKERLYAGIISLARTIMQAQGLRITGLGTENIRADGGAVLAMNHTGHDEFVLDGVHAYLLGKRKVRYIAMKKIFGITFIAWQGKKKTDIRVERSAGGS